MEKSYPAAVYIVKYLCDICKVGEMIFTGTIINNNIGIDRDKFQHGCTRCPSNQALEMQYPHIKHEFGEMH